jgi:alkylation response protein AidB-like acyl-CoA dehydrogenase
MPIGITAEHEELGTIVRRFVEAHAPSAVVRAAVDTDRYLLADVAPFWHQLCALGWSGLHVPEALGGAGYGAVELAVVLEELGRGCVPGPFLPTVLAGLVLTEAAEGKTAKAFLPEIASGVRIATVALTGALRADAVPGGLRLSGSLEPVLCASLADVALAPVDRGDGDVVWCALELDDPAVTVVDRESVDLTRRAGRIDVAGAVVALDEALATVSSERVHDLAAVLLAAEAIGVAQWCVETAGEYAKARVQFGRPIGQFQAVKHRCAEMLARTELARAGVWDAARALDTDSEGDADNGAPLAIAGAASLALDAAFENAKDCVQTLGGIGFTWEHDAHLYLRRAITLHQLAAPPGRWRQRAARLALAGVRRRLALDVGSEADRLRAELRVFFSELTPLDAQARQRRLADDGYITPSWPKPWGRDATALELLVIEEEFRAAKVVRPGIMVGAWALPNLIVYGTPEQQERWIRPTLRGEMVWCQLFSEPGAGSDLAGLSTRAQRVDGGWIVNGQKVWTSMAKEADWGILLARTDPDRPKHEGISCFMVDMRTRGIDIRPLRELTGHAMFNEVFFDDVFVPDDCLVGEEHDGWRCARTTLANERVYMGSSNTIGGGVVGVLRELERQGLTDDTAALEAAGGLAATGHALAVLGYRLTLAALRGADPSGSEAAVRKLLGVQHDQRVQELGLCLAGARSVTTGDDDAGWVQSFLFNRCLTIAGGTTDIQKNVIAERLLGLPRDP